jgi:hypothetical protein
MLQKVRSLLDKYTSKGFISPSMSAPLSCCMMQESKISSQLYKDNNYIYKIVWQYLEHVRWMGIKLFALANLFKKIGTNYFISQTN